MLHDLAPRPKQALRHPLGRGETTSTDMGNGILSVSTSSHGGLMIPKEMAKHIPQAVRESFLNQSRQATWAGEDCEMTIAIAFLFDHLDPWTALRCRVLRKADPQVLLDRAGPGRSPSGFPDYKPPRSSTLPAA